MDTAIRHSSSEALEATFGLDFPVLAFDGAFFGLALFCTFLGWRASDLRLIAGAAVDG